MFVEAYCGSKYNIVQKIAIKSVCDNGIKVKNFYFTSKSFDNSADFLLILVLVLRNG